MASIIDGGVSIFKLVRQSEDRVIEQREGEKGGGGGGGWQARVVYHVARISF